MTMVPLVTYSSFVAAFPEFTSQAKYSISGVNFWLGQAYLELNAARFGRSLPLGVMLFVAHNITLGARNAAAAASGAPAGEATGPTNSKSVGPVSIGYDTGAVATEAAGIYNSTSYGQRLWKMMQQFTSGPVYRAPRNFGFGAFGFPGRRL